MQHFDHSRAKLSKKELFKRFRVTNSESLLEAVNDKKISMKDKVLFLKQDEEKLAFSLVQMAYHDVAQGI